MNICFVSNFEKTLVFNEVAKTLIKNHNFNVYWIVVNSQYKTVLEKEYPKDHILYIHKDIKTNTEAIGEYKLNEIIYNDRFLSFNKSAGISFLKAIQKPIYDFLHQNNVKCVFGELTWSHELVISRIINDKKELNCKYYCSSITRLPANRFFFFENEREDLSIDTSVNYNSLNHPIIELKSQEYIKIYDEMIKKSYSLGTKLKRMKRFLSKENVEKNDPSLLYNFKERLKRGLKQEINRSAYKLFKTVDVEYLEDKKFVLYTLHVQPEASVDVLGKYYNDQYLNIINIWRILPNKWQLVVKEHSNGVGDRKLSFYKELATLPNVVFVNEKANSHQLIAMSQAIFTVSGTIAYEAALLKKTAFTFAPMFFNKLKFCHKITLEDFNNCSNMQELIFIKTEKDNKVKMDIEAFSNYVYHHSNEGVWEPVYEQVLDADNIKKLVTSILKKNDLFQN